MAKALFERWGNPLMDMFANAENSKTPVFSSWRSEEETHHVDEMTPQWQGIQEYAFPPLALLQRVLPKVFNRCLPLLPDLLLQHKGKPFCANLEGLVAGSMEIKRKALIAVGLSEQFARTIIPTRSHSTYQAYECGWCHFDSQLLN